MGLPERGSVDADGVTVMAQPGKQRLDHGAVAQELVPFVVLEIGGDNRGTTVVALLHELEEDVGLLGSEVEVSHLVDDEQVKPGEVVERNRSRDKVLFLCVNHRPTMLASSCRRRSGSGSPWGP